MKKRILVLIGGVLLISAFVYYRSAKDILWGTKTEELTTDKNKVTNPRDTGAEATRPTPTNQNNTTAKVGRDVSAETSYPVPGDSYDHLRFVVSIDANGLIQKIQTLDADTNEVPTKKVEFTEQINAILKGKKLSELTKIDKVGKSTLTTDAFNSVLAKLQENI